METEKIIADLKQKILELETEGNILRERLNKYILKDKDKNYYEKNKQACKARVKKYQEENKPSKEQKRIYARTAYLNRKQKLKAELDKKINENIKE